MSDTRVASRYAKSLFLMATESNIINEIESDAKSILGLASESRPFDVMLKSPVVGGERKFDIINQLFKGNLNPNTMDFIKMVFGKRRDVLMELILQKFLDMVQESRGIVKALVTTASVISEDTLLKIKEYVKKEIGKEVDVKVKVDERLIGGYTIQFEDKLIDASVASKLRDVRKKLLSAN